MLWDDQTHCSASDPVATLLVVSVRYRTCGSFPQDIYQLGENK